MEAIRSVPALLDRQGDLITHEDDSVSSGTSDSRADIHLIAHDDEFLRSLRRNDFEFHHRRVPNPFPGTCGWILACKEYQDWIQSDASSILYISGSPGCGKSVLASFLANQIPRASPLLVASYFFKDDDEIQSYATVALSSLLYQIMHLKPQVISPTKIELMSVTAQPTTELENMWRVVSSLASSTELGDVVFIIDGLDACRKSQQSAFLSHLKHFCSHHSRRHDKSLLKFLITSRPVASIDSALRSFSYIALRSLISAQSIRADMRTFIRAKAAGLRKATAVPHFSDPLARQILAVADRSCFLWADAVLDVLATYQIEREDSVQNLEGLTQIYSFALRSSLDQPLMKKVLKILVAANRPLSILELSFLLGWKIESRSHADFRSNPDIEHKLRQSCGILIRIVESKVILHSSILRDKLARTISQHKGELSDCALNMTDSHFFLAQACVSYLRSENFDQNPFDTSEPLSIFVDDAEILALKDKYVLLDYASRNWTKHFRESGEDARILDAAIALCDIGSPRYKLWRALMLNTTNPLLLLASTMPSDVAVAASLDLRSVVSNCLSLRIAMNGPGSVMGNPLHIGALNGYTELVRLLLTNGADPTVKNEGNGTPLYVAAFHGHAEVARLLFDACADPMQTEDELPTPLHIAAKNGHDSVVRLFSEKGISLSLELKVDGVTPLHLACRDDRQTTVALLLAAGADPNALDHSGASPLHWACGRDNVQVVETLLAHGANINVQDEDGVTALGEACTEGNASIVELLLTSHADPNITGKDDEVALHAATRHGHEACIRHLLAHGANIEAKDSHGGTALHKASTHGNLPIVTLLLDLGASPHARLHDSFVIPVHLAVVEGHDEVVQALLTHKSSSDPNVATNDGHTSMHLAAMTGQPTMILRSYYSGGDLSRRNDQGKTPMDIAAENRLEWVVKAIMRCIASNADSQEFLEPNIEDVLAHIFRGKQSSLTSTDVSLVA